MVDISFPGISQLFVGGVRPPHLAALTPLSVIADIYRAPGFPGGIFNNGFAQSWLLDRKHDGEPAPEGGQQWAIDRVGWRGALVWYIGVIVALVPAALLTYPTRLRTPPRPPAPDDPGVRAIIMSRPFWLLAVTYAIAPAVGIMATVHWEALKHGIGTMTADIPPMRSLARRGLLFTPFFTIVYFLHAGYSPSKAALYSMLTAIVVSWVAGDSPMTPRKIFETFTEAMRSGVIIASVLAASGLIVASMSRTGFALAFSSAIINLSGGYVIVALFLVFVVISVLGTGIPTTPAYILAVTVGGASLTNMGVDLLAAHLFVFYYAVLADVTPPVAVTAVAGAQIAGANPMTTGWHATRFGIGGFLAPFLFAFQPALLWNGTYVEIAITFISALVGISALSAAVAGHMFGPLTWPSTIFLVVVALAAISPYLSVSLASSVILIVYMVWDYRIARPAAAPTLRVTERPTIASSTDAPPLT